MHIKSQIKWICVVSFLDLFAISIVIPLLSPHVRSLGATHFISGLISSLYSGLQLFSGPLIGSWSDARGRRSILLLTLPICSFCYICLGVASTIALILVARIGLGSLKHTQTLCRALVSDLVPGPRQTEVIGMITSISGAGFIAGPIIGGHLTELENGFLYVCVLVAVIFVINLGIVYTVLPMHQPSRNDANKQSTVSNEMLKVLENLANVDWALYWDIFALNFLLSFTMSVFFSEYSISIKDKFQLSPKWVGYTIAFQGLVGSASGFSVRFLDKIYGPTKTRNLQIFHGFVFLSLSLIGIGMAHSLTLFIAFLMPLGACNALLRIVSSETMLRRTSVDKKGTIIGTNSSISSVARLVAPVSAGFVRDMFGTEGISALTVVMALLGTVIAGVIYSHRSKIKVQ